MMNPLFLLTASLTVLPSILANPVPTLRRGPGSILPRDSLHDCGVFIQRASPLHLLTASLRTAN